MITHLMNGVDVGMPRNWQDIEITIDWLNKKESGAVNVSDLAFVGLGNKIIQEHIRQGLFGGVGIFEGIPYKILIGQTASPVYVFDGYLDLTDNPDVIGGEEIITSLKKVKGDDWLNDIADSFSFAYLKDIGIITNSDYVKVPYVINYVPDGMQLLLLSMSIYMMTKELVENIEKISEAIADIINASTPVVGVSVGVGAGVVTAWDLGDFILASLKVLARIVYAVAIVIAIAKMVNEIFEQMMPRLRYHKGMTFLKMYEKACSHLGLEFQSTILQQTKKNWVHIPEKGKKGDDNDTGHPTNTSPIYTFGDLIRVTKKMFNADYRILNGKFIFERKDNFQTEPGYIVPAVITDQIRLLDRFIPNTNEMISNYNIYWNYDVQDQNTLNNQEGRVFQAITSPISTNNAELVTIKDLSQIDIPFTMGLEKTELTAVETILKELAQVVDIVTGIFGGGTNFSSKIEKRIGALLLSSHFITQGKVVVMQGSKLMSNQRQILSTNRLWEDYHSINTFALLNGQHGQYLRKKDVKVPMSESQFFTLLETNKATSEDGDDIYIEKVVYTPDKQTAKIDYRVKKLYTKNLKITIVQ